MIAHLKTVIKYFMDLFCFALVRVPDKGYFHRYNLSESPEYGIWIDRFEKNTLNEWKCQYGKIKKWKDKPLISVITPIYNTPSPILYECVESVLFQSYQRWELILIDDCSDDPETLNCLEKIKKIKDKRIKIIKNKKNSGTCLSTNKGVNNAFGEYIAILDHDDRLNSNALFEVTKTILNHNRPDMIYSDRDLISPAGKRHDRISKPSWSPESLLSGNYLFHLVVIKKPFFLRIGGYRREFEGSQDLDFLLRLAEKTNHVVHIPKVLYNFRQAKTSCSYDLNSKEYIFETGVNAVQDALDRRNIDATAYEIKNIWRGNYALSFNNTLDFSQIIYSHSPTDNLADYLNQQIKSSSKGYFAINGGDVRPGDEDTNRQLVSFFQIPRIGCVTGKIFRENKIFHAGLVNGKEGKPLNLFFDCDSKTPGLLASASIMRNVTLVHPWCFAVTKDIWEQLGGFDSEYKGIYTIFDFAMRCLQCNRRNLYIPFAQYQVDKKTQVLFDPEEITIYKKKWTDILNLPDPYYNSNLSLCHPDMRLRSPH